MGILYQASDPIVWAIWLFVVFALMAFNEFGRTSVWGGVALLIACTVPTLFTKRGAWLQHRAHLTAFFVVSLIALAANVALAAYQFHRISTSHLNPLKDELYKNANFDTNRKAFSST